MVSELSRDGWRSWDPLRPVLFVNPRSGGGKAARAAVAARARDRGIETVILAPGQRLEALARRKDDGLDPSFACPLGNRSPCGLAPARSRVDKQHRP